MLAPHIKDHAELVVASSEAAIYAEEFVVARRIIVRYFQLSPQKDSLFVRAKIVMALIINFESRDLHGTLKIQSGEKSMKELLDGLDVAIAPANLSRYRFMVYNLSLAAWTVVRPFLRTNRAKSFATSFQAIITALEAQDDSDKDWRIMLLSASAICFDDAGNNKGASDNVDKAISLMEGLLQITTSKQEKIDKDLAEIKKEVEAAMNAFRAIEDREELMRKPRKIDPDLLPDDPYYTTPLTYTPLAGLAAGMVALFCYLSFILNNSIFNVTTEGREKVKEALDVSQFKRTQCEAQLREVMDIKHTQTESLLRLHRQRIVVNIADARKYSTLPNVVKDIRIASLVNLQCLQCNAVPEKEAEAFWPALIKKLEDAPNNDLRNETLLDVSRAAFVLNSLPNAIRCLTIVQQSNMSISQILRIKADICESLLSLHSIDKEVTQAAQRQHLNQREIAGMFIQKRLEVLKALERTLNMSLSVKDKFLIVEITVLTWNNMVTLLTSKLRPRLQSVLKSLCKALDGIAADDVSELRAKLHFELSLAEEAADFAGLALTEVQKAHHLDSGNLACALPGEDMLDMNRLSDQVYLPWIEQLALRIDVFASPARKEDQAFLWLQQASESTSKNFVKEMITKSAVLLFDAPKPTDDVIVGGNVDWSLLLMKCNVKRIPMMSVDTLIEGVGSTTSSLEKAAFSYSLQRNHRLYMKLAFLAHKAGEVAVLQKSIYSVLKTSFWEVKSEPYSREFLDDQVEALCMLAESCASRIYATNSHVNGENKAVLLALGTSLPDMSNDLVANKVLCLKALEAAMTIASYGKDIFIMQNVFIYFWNLHLHIFRENYYSCVSEDFVKTLQKAFGHIEEMLAFAHVDNCDIRLCVNLIEGLVSVLEQRGQLQGAYDVGLKGLSLPFPGKILSYHAYLKRSLSEKVSKLQVQLALAAGVGGKGGGKGGSSLELLEPNPPNPWLSFFNTLALAELTPDFCSPSPPAELLLDALERAKKSMEGEVKVSLEEEEKGEKNGAGVGTSTPTPPRKEVVQGRGEMLLEGYTRLARCY
ncbi:hypothetical protein EON65_43345, partial [archaeon]